MSRAGAVALLLGLAVALGGLPSAAVAERVRTDAVGVVPAGPGARQAALQAGVREAVLLVAVELAREAGARTEARDVLGSALGADLLPYAVQYALIEDRGERPAQLVQQPGVDREYVVLVEVQVERERVRDALIRSGLLGAPTELGVRSLWITLEGVDAWPTWERLRRALAARGGALHPVEFSRGIVIAELQTDESNEALLERLRRAVGSTLDLRLEGSEPGSLRLRVVASAPTDDIPGLDSSP